MTSPQVNAAIAGWLQARHRDWDIRQIALSDGGDGFLEAVQASNPGAIESHSLDVPGPLPEQSSISAEYLWHPERKQIFIEAAEIHGIRRLPDGLQGGTRATSYGVGRAVLDLARRHPQAEEIILTVGGSASTDGGMGFLQGLGWRFCDAQDQLLPEPIEAMQIAKIQRAEPAALPVGFPRLTLLSDVESPYIEAPSRFGPQKGVTLKQVVALEAAFAHVASLIDPTGSLAGKPGSGAAGGLGFGIMAAGLPGFSAMAGIDWIARETGLEAALKDADQIITGEGRFDETSLVGKGPGYLVREAARLNIPVIVVCGKSTVSDDPAANLRFLPLYAANETVTEAQMTRQSTEERMRRMLDSRADAFEVSD